MPMVPEAIVAMLACARLGVHALRGLRRFLGVGAGGPHRGRRGQAGDHHRRSVPARQGGVAEGAGRRGDRSGQDRGKKPGRARSRGAPHRDRHAVDRWPRPVVARDRRHGVARAHAGGVRLRTPAVPALHLGYHRQAQGHHAHLRWLSDAGLLHPPQRLRHQARDRRLLVHSRYRLGHRPHLHRLRAAVQRRHPGGLRGHARPHPTSTATSRSSKSTV